MIVIIGAGLAGLSAAYHLKSKYKIYEKESKVGGVASSEEIDGFIFDYGIHVLHTKNRYVLDLLNNLLGENLPVQAREAWIYMNDRYIKYPFQANLYGLPFSVIKDCVLGFIKSKYEHQAPQPPKNYNEWLCATFGKGIANHFMIPFSKKMWTVDPKLLTLEWVDVRVPQPTIREVFAGALNLQKKEFGPNVQFRYPLYQGIQAVSDALASKLSNIKLNKEVIKIDPKKKTIYFKNGKPVRYDKLISTIPLPELVKIVKGIPVDVRKAAKNLKCNSDFIINLGIDKPDLSSKHWVYFPEAKFPLLRLSLPANLSSFTVLPGKSAISVEVFYSQFKKINKKAIVEKVINGLRKAGFLPKNNKILFVKTRDIKYAYVIYTHGRKRNIKIIHRFLKQNDIYPAGRFGEWGYLWMDEAILSGKKAAKELTTKT